MSHDATATDPAVDQQRKDEAKAARLRKRAQAEIARADKILKDDSLGEMEAQILQSRKMEYAFNLLCQAAILLDDSRALKLASEQASAWAAHTRSVLTFTLDDPDVLTLDDHERRRRAA